MNNATIPKKTQMYAPALEGRAGRLATKSDLYVLLEPQYERLESPTVVRRRVPEETATDSGFVRPEPHFGHLNLSATGAKK